MTKALTKLEPLPETILKTEDPEVREIMLAHHNNTRINKIEVDDLKDKMVELLGTCYYNLGYKQDSNKKTAAAELALLAYAVIKLIKKKFHNLTIKEIEIAFENGSLKQYGEVYGITPSTISSWLIEYQRSEQKARAMQRIKDAKQEQEERDKVKPTEKEKEQIAIQAAITVFDHYKKTGKILDINNATFGFINQKGLIIFDYDAKQQIMQKARQNLKAKARIEITEAKQAHKIKQIRESMNKLQDKFNNTVHSEAKRIALEIYFKQLIKNKQHIKDILKSDR